MPQAYELCKMLEEILEDQKVDASPNTKLSQAEIGRLVQDVRKSATKKGRRTSRPLGEELLHRGLITPEQLSEALELQSRKGGKIGSLLVELGHITSEDLSEVLGEQYGIEGISLLNSKGSEKAMKLVPLSVILKHRVLPLKAEGRMIKLAMENPDDLTAIHDVEFITGRRIEPVIVPSYQMDLAMSSIEKNGVSFFLAPEAHCSLDRQLTLQVLIKQMNSLNASDVLITSGMPPCIKSRTDIIQTSLPVITSEQCVLFTKSLMSEKQWEEFLVRKELEFSLEYEGVARFRVVAYRQKSTISLALRRIPQTIASLQDLGLPLWLEDIAMEPHGLVIFAGPTGHGKTTTLHAVVDIINSKRKCNIISLEDPVEYLHKPKVSCVSQREIGIDANSFSEGLRRIFRQSPDVIVIGELQDPETIEAAIRAALSGCLVLTTFHATSTRAVLENLISIHPQHIQTRIRQQISEAILLVFVQKLLPKEGPNSLHVTYEKLVKTQEVQKFIRGNIDHGIDTPEQQHPGDFSSMDHSLAELVKEGRLCA